MNTLDYYSQQSPVSDPQKYEANFKNLSSDIKELVKIVQGIITHRDSSDFYHLELTEERKQEGETRYVPKIVEKVLEHDDEPLNVTRTPDKRFSGVCRDFEIILTSILRSKGIPARLRCGFAGYFSDFYEDHWLTEYWNETEKRWVLVDANVDDVEREAYHVTIDINDVPYGPYLFAGDVWLQCRQGKLDPNNFGVSSIGAQGMWFIRNNVIRDLAALNKVEVLPWDEWGLADKEFEDMTEDELKIIDEAARLAIDNDRFEEMKAFYEDQPLLKAPRIINSHTTYSGLQKVELKG